MHFSYDLISQKYWAMAIHGCGGGGGSRLPVGVPGPYMETGLRVDWERAVQAWSVIQLERDTASKV